jgi:hypothetical protein
METKVTLFELFISVAPVAIALIGGWIHMKVTIGAIKTQLGYVEKELAEEKEGNKNNYEKLNSKMDTLFSKIGEVRELILKKNNP